MKITKEGNYLVFRSKDKRDDEEFNACWDRGVLHFTVKHVGYRRGSYEMILAPSIRKFKEVK